MYTTKQVADKLGIAHGTVRDYIADKRIKATKFGHTNLVDEKEMQRLLKKYRKEVK